MRRKQIFPIFDPVFQSGKVGMSARDLAEWMCTVQLFRLRRIKKTLCCELVFSLLLLYSSTTAESYCCFHVLFAISYGILGVHAGEQLRTVVVFCPSCRMKYQGSKVTMSPSQSVCVAHPISPPFVFFFYLLEKSDIIGLPVLLADRGIRN